MNNIISKFNDFLNNENLDLILQKTCDLLKNEKEHYDWVGFYFKNGDKNELKLGPFSGLATDHDIIPFGKGICGQVALSNETFVVPDVMAQDNYLSCNMHVKSEIVMPVFVFEQNIGQIDIDSNTLDAFKTEDIDLLNYITDKIGEVFEKQNRQLYYV